MADDDGLDVGDVEQAVEHVGGELDREPPVHGRARRCGSGLVVSTTTTTSGRPAAAPLPSVRATRAWARRKPVPFERVGGAVLGDLLGEPGGHGGRRAGRAGVRPVSGSNRPDRHHMPSPSIQVRSRVARRWRSRRAIPSPRWMARTSAVTARWSSSGVARAATATSWSARPTSWRRSEVRVGVRPGRRRRRGHRTPHRPRGRHRAPASSWRCGPVPGCGRRRGASCGRRRRWPVPGTRPPGPAGRRAARRARRATPVTGPPTPRPATSARSRQSWCDGGDPCRSARAPLPPACEQLYPRGDTGSAPAVTATPGCRRGAWQDGRVPLSPSSTPR